MSISVARRCLAVIMWVPLGFLATATQERSRLLGQQVPAIDLTDADATADAQFTQITSVRELNDGRLLVADRVEMRLTILDLRTSATTLIGKIGRGPGEYRGVGWLYSLPGDSTLLTDSFTGRWILLSGELVVGSVSEAQPTVRRLPQLLAGTDGRGRVLGAVRGDLTTARQRTRSLGDSLMLVLVDRVSWHADTIARLNGRANQITIGQARAGQARGVYRDTPFSSEEQALLHFDGWIAVARLNPYRVDWRMPDERWVFGPPLPWTEVKLDAAEKCAAMQRWHLGGEHCDPSFLAGWPETVPPFLPTIAPPSLFAAPDGRLVIARSQTLAAPERRYDVIDRRGHLSGTLTLQPNEAIVGFGRQSVFVAVTDEFDLQTVRRYRWPG